VRGFHEKARLCQRMFLRLDRFYLRWTAGEQCAASHP
jgi:hypothetical protein